MIVCEHKIDGKKCGKKREPCFKCDGKHGSKCIEHTEEYERIGGRVICLCCKDRFLCPDEDCNTLRTWNKCVKTNCKERVYVCKTHTEESELICKKCVNEGECEDCKKSSDTLWRHECGVFCEDCRKPVKVVIRRAKPITDKGAWRPVLEVFCCDTCMKGHSPNSYKRKYVRDNDVSDISAEN